MAVAGASQTQNGMIMAWANVVWALDGCTTRRPAAKNGVRHGGVARAMRRGGAAKRPLPKAECVSRQLALGVAGRKNSIEGFLVLIIAYRRGTCLVLSCLVERVVRARRVVVFVSGHETVSSMAATAAHGRSCTLFLLSITRSFVFVSDKYLFANGTLA